jgi:arylformamidase
MTLIDITLPMSNALASWPGDTPCDFRLAWRISEAASVNVGSLTTSVHSGTHTDAPFHFLPDGKTIDQLDLTPYVGAAIVVDVRGREVIRPEDFPAHVDMRATPRVLLKTDAWMDITQFPTSIPVLAPGVATSLHARGVILIGVDVPSVDALDSKDLPVHHEIGRCGIYILENLYLRDVTPGTYELIALPLKIVGGDGAPVRAVLRKITR